MASNPIVLITGANTGLGLEIVKSLCQSSTAYTVLLAGRDSSKADAAAAQVRTQFPNSLSTIHTVQVDIEDDDSISQAFDHVAAQFGHLDVLINNAGGQFDQQPQDTKKAMRDVWNKSWNVNVTGTYILTHSLVPLLLNSSNPKIIFITSGTSTLAGSGTTAFPMDQSPAKGWPKASTAIPAYRSSKTGLNMMMREWARLLKEDGVKTWCVSPDFLATGLGGHQESNQQAGAGDPKLGANFVMDVVEGARDEDVGKVIKRADQGTTQAW